MKRIKVRLKDVLKERGISQQELALSANVRPNAISNLCRNYVDRLNIEHLEKIMTYLKIDDIRELIEVTEVEE